MQTDKFIKLCLSRGKEFLRRKRAYDTNSLSWENYFRLANLTKLVDYDCRFTALGCKREKVKRKEKQAVLEKFETKGETPHMLMCCCGGCWHSMGYVSYFPNDPRYLKRIAKYYNEKLGFWRVDKGCILPRKYRSPTCLRHSCGPITPGESGGRLMRYLSMSERQIREDHLKRTGRDVYYPDIIITELEADLRREIRDENRANSKQT